MKRTIALLLSLALVETSVSEAFAAGARIVLNAPVLGGPNASAAGAASGSSALSLQASQSSTLALPAAAPSFTTSVMPVVTVSGETASARSPSGGASASVASPANSPAVKTHAGSGVSANGISGAEVSVKGSVKTNAPASAVSAAMGMTSVKSKEAGEGGAASGGIAGRTAEALGVSPSSLGKAPITAGKLNALFDASLEAKKGEKDPGEVEGGGGFEGATPAESGLKKAVEPDMEAFGAAMRTQGLLLGVASRLTGMHITILSMALNMHRDAGLSLADWMQISQELAVTEADEAEIAAVFARELQSTRFSAPIGENDKLSEEDFMDLSMELRGAASAVVIARNGQYFNWLHSLGAAAKHTDFSKAKLRQAGKDWEITFGVFEGRPIRALMDGGLSTQESTAKHIGQVLEAARAAGADVSGLLRLAQELESRGLIAAGWAKKAETPGAKLYGGVAFGLAGLTVGSIWLAAGLAALALFLRMAWIVLSQPAPDEDTIRNYHDKLERAAALRQLADPKAGTPSLAASGRMNPEAARELAAELTAEAREAAGRHPDLAWPLFARIVRSMAAPFKGFFKEAAPGLGDPHWIAVAPAVRAEIAEMRKLGSKAERRDYLRRKGDEIMAKIKAVRGTEEVGFHYNLHGGQAEGYMNGGIHATRGDISLQYTTNPTASMLAHKVYFFRDSMNLFDVLNESHPQMFFIPSRMGSVLMLFRLDSDYLKRAFAEGGAYNPSPISIDFNENWLAREHKGRVIGIPADTFLSDPLSVFHRVKARIGHKGRLSRDEETLATMRYIEAVMTSGSAGNP